MGCGQSKIVEQEKKPAMGYPVCKLSLPISLEIDSIAAYNDEKIVLGAKGELQLYDIKQKNITVISKDHLTRINSIIKLSNGYIVTAGQDSNILIWDIEKNKCIGSLKGHTSYIWTINELKNNKLISGSDDKQCKVWDLKNFKEDFTLYKSHKEISEVIQLKNEKILLATGKQLLLFELKTKKQIACAELKGGAWVLKEISNGDILAGQGKGVIAVIQVTDEVTIKNLIKNVHTKTVTFCIELDNKKIVTAADDNEAVLWDINEPDYKFLLKGHTNVITGLTKISGNSFATVSRDNTLKIWE